MKEFNLELAKAGHPVQTRDGRKARIICWDRESRECCPILALVVDNDGNEMCFSYAIDGVINGGYGSKYNLVMAPEKHEGWVNVYRDDTTKEIVLCSVCFHSRESADSHIGWSGHTYLATIKIEWEE